MLHGSQALSFPRAHGSCLRAQGRSGRCCLRACAARVYIAATPLEGMERIDSMLGALGRSAQKLAALHTMTIIEENIDGEADAKTYTLFDFLPVNATAPATAASLLAGGKWPGLKRERQLRRKPAYRHQALVGEAIVPQAADAARRFNETWDPDIQLLRHDCHHHTAALVESLTGKSIDVWRLFPVHQRTVWL
ncbi:hypothetical protein CVIRNUC_008094 [Coccomyxa viridis]|uniref:Uncharacterized protein n=1 Tax=Coccomyxa viridis TaxID=1274662 RepID=A0AAV1IC32_9CHLO|nr:hypothetical protein CVIRNUC_008094 [Coccomyxa viridis]